MKAQILAILRTSDAPISGEQISAQLAISRVAVWKHIQKLQTCGYVIKATGKGYCLEESPDIPYPWEFPRREATLHYVATVSSTMDVARDMALAGCPHMTVVVAGHQSKGRGRMQRVWQSDEGGLYFTMVLRPQLPPTLSHRVNFAASLSLARTLRETLQLPAMVKWPNDILVEERKVAGMLSELAAEADMVTYLNIGLGINVNNDPRTIEPRADALARILGRTVSRKSLLAAYLDRFEQQMQSLDDAAIIDEWKTYSIRLPRKVRLVTFKAVLEGTAEDIDENGALLLRLPDGSITRVLHGDCFLRPQ